MGLAKREQVRARDGDDCWWCFRPMDFAATARKTQAPTIEHLLPLSLGGTGRLDNLVLCHPGCNRQLGNRPRAEKERLRARRLRRAGLKQAAAVLVTADPKLSVSASRRLAKDWQHIAWHAISVAAFFAGVCVGMMVG